MRGRAHIRDGRMSGINQLIYAPSVPLSDAATLCLLTFRRAANEDFESRATNWSKPTMLCWRRHVNDSG